MAKRAIEFSFVRFINEIAQKFDFLFFCNFIHDGFCRSIRKHYEVELDFEKVKKVFHSEQSNYLLLVLSVKTA